MSRSVTIAAGQSNVQLPNGNPYSAGQTVTLTDEQFARIPAADIPSVIIDNGVVPSAGDAVVIQGVDVPAAAALTSTAPAALTAPAAFSAAYTVAEENALRADVAALSAVVAAMRADDAALRTTLNAALVALEGVGKALA